MNRLRGLQRVGAQGAVEHLGRAREELHAAQTFVDDLADAQLRDAYYRARSELDRAGNRAAWLKSRPEEVDL